MRRTVSIAVGVAAVAAAVTVPGVSQAESPHAIEWGKCAADVGDGVPLPEGMQCGTLQVPLDPRKPTGRTIEIAVSRVPSKHPEKRRGVLLTNPGGPSAGLGYPAFLVAGGLPQEVRDSFDLIGFDPRGVGRSTPVTCDLTQAQQNAGNVPPYARNAADVTARAEQSAQIAKQCAASKSAWMLPYTSTANVARDMDRIRMALGEEKVSFAGASWGTHLGAVYTTLFPQRSDRILLDSNLAPGGWDYHGDRLYAQGFQDRFADFAKFAAANHREFGLGRTPAAVTAGYQKLAARLDKTPVHEVDGPTLRMITFVSLYGGALSPYLAQTLQALEANRTPPEFPGGSGGAKDLENLVSSRYYLICNDSRWPTSVATYQRAVAVDRIKYPLFGAAGANVQPCAFWPDAIDKPVQVNDKGPSNVLLIQNLRDPATPLAGARELRRAFGDRARLVTADQGGHGVYPRGKNRCANNAATTFLTTGRLPATDYHCTSAAEPR